MIPRRKSPAGQTIPGALAKLPKSSPNSAGIQVDDFPTTRERFSAPANNLIALLEESAISIALRAEIYHGAERILHRVKFTIPLYQEIAAKIRSGIIDVLCREITWKQLRAMLHADPEIAALVFAAFPRRTFTDAEMDLHRSLKTYIAQL